MKGLAWDLAVGEWIAVLTVAQQSQDEVLARAQALDLAAHPVLQWKAGQEVVMMTYSLVLVARWMGACVVLAPEAQCSQCLAWYPAS